LLRPTRYYQSCHGRHELELELREDAALGLVQVLGPILHRQGHGSAPDLATELPVVQNAFHLVRFILAPGEGWLRPVLESATFSSERALTDEGLSTLIGWAQQIFDRGLGYLDRLARTGRREPALLAGDPASLAPLQDQLRSLKTQVQDTERQIDHIRRCCANTSHVLPRFL